MNKEPIVNYYAQVNGSLMNLGASLPMLLRFPLETWLYLRGFKAKTTDVLAYQPEQLIPISEDSKVFGLEPGVPIVCKASELIDYTKFKDQQTLVKAKQP